MSQFKFEVMTAGKKAALTRKRRAAGHKAAITRKRRAAQKFLIRIYESHDVQFTELSLADALDAVKEEILKNGVPQEIMPLSVTVCGDAGFDLDYGVTYE